MTSPRQFPKRRLPKNRVLPWLMALGIMPVAAHTLDADITYTPPDWPVALQADLYRPSGPGPYPVVLMVHGGSWRIGSRKDGYITSLCKQLSDAGIACLSASYRLVPAGRFPASGDDLRQALRWIRRSGPGYGLDPARTGAWGYSAGAHLVALLGAEPAADPEGARIRAVVAGGTPADLRLWPDSDAVNAYLGVPLKTDPARWAAASPVTRVNAGSAPFFLYHGRLDRLVEPGQAERLRDALQAAGVPVTLRWLPFSGHITTALFPGHVVDEAIAFLQANLSAPVAVPGP